MLAYPQPAETVLLGGIPEGSQLLRRVQFREVTGWLELQIADVGAGKSRTARESTLVGAVIESIEGRAMEPTIPGRMCMGDRQWVLLCLERRLAGDRLWIHPTCRACQAVFDVDIRRSGIPTKPAGSGFPYATATIEGRTARVRVPTGADQESLGGLSWSEARTRLLLACMVDVDGQEPDPEFIGGLPDAAIEAIETALDDVAPDVGHIIEVVCPECDAHQQVALDPYRRDLTTSDSLFEEVHMLASEYHWSENRILSLPRARRRAYARLIERSRGYAGD